MYVCVGLCVIIFNTPTEAIKLEDIGRLQLSLVVWLLLYCHMKLYTMKIQCSKSLLSCCIVELRLMMI